MTRNKFTAALLLVLLMALIAPVAHAQSTNDLGQQILRYLGPRGGGFGYWDIFFLYPLFFLSLVTMFMQGDKELTTTLLMAGVLVMIVLSKLAPLGVFETFNGDPFIFGYPKGLLLFVLHAGIFVLPLITAGMTKAKRSRGPAIITGILGGVYLFGFWFIMQRPGSEIPDRLFLPFGM